MQIITITWAWGQKRSYDFDPAQDKLDFGWFQKNEFTITEVNGSTVIAVPSNDQTYTLKGVKMSQINMNDIIAKDGNTVEYLKKIFGGEVPPAPVPPTPDPVPPTPDPVPPTPDPVPPTPDPVPPTPDPVPPTPPAPIPVGDKYYSPYIDMGLWASRNFPSMAMQAGLKSITLAFLVGEGNSMKWGGSGGGIDAFAPQIREAQANGCEVIVSFGGALGVDPAVSYTSANALAADLQKVVDLGVKKLDFDIEASNVGNHEANNRRGAALSQLRAANPDLEISFTLAVLPTGLVESGVEIVRQAKQFGFEVDVVKVMAMDYCQRISDMGQAAIDAGKNTLAQMKQLGLNNTKVGIIPMIGCNDSYRDYGELFSLQDAQRVLDYVRSNDEMVSIGIWSLTRDNGGQPRGEASYASSGIDIELYAFSKIFREL